MKLKHPTKRAYAPYYRATLAVIFILYCWTVGSYLSNAPKSWVHSKSLALVITVVLFVGGAEVCFLVFDWLYPKISAKRSLKCLTNPPLLVRIVAFFIDLVIAFVFAVVLTSVTLGQRTSSGFIVAGWRAGVLLALVFLYFFILNKYLGGTLAKRLFRIN